MIAAGQTIHGNFSGAGDIDQYSFDAKAGTIYRFELTSEQAGADFATAHYVMGIMEAQPWNPMPTQPQDAQEAYPGHNTRFATLDDLKALGLAAEWVAPASGTYHFSIAPLDAAHAGAYTVVMSERAFPCDPQNPSPQPSPLSTGARGQEVTSPNTQPTTSSPAGRQRKPRLHHRRLSPRKHESPSAKGHLNSSTQRSLLLARD